MPTPVLLVDDSGTIRSLIKIFLTKLDLSFHEASDGTEGITVARIHQPRLVIVDYKMPGMDGLTFCKQMRGNVDTALREIPIIMLTGIAGDDVAREALAAGADKVLRKPINGEELASAVKRLIALRAPGGV